MRCSHPSYPRATEAEEAVLPQSSAPAPGRSWVCKEGRQVRLEADGEEGPQKQPWESQSSGESVGGAVRVVLLSQVQHLRKKLHVSASLAFQGSVNAVGNVCSLWCGTCSILGLSRETVW